MIKKTILLLLLCGCTQTTATQTQIKAVYSQIDAIEQSLTTDCTANSIKMNLGALKTQINAIESTCNTDIEKEKQEKIKWKTSFLGLIFVILIYIVRKILK